jgi:hypothetical protein
VRIQNMRRGRGYARCDIDDTTVGDEHVAARATIGQRRVTDEEIGHGRQRSFGAEDAVAGIAEPRYDVAVVVQLPVDRGRVDRHVRVRGLERRDPLRA